MSIRSISTQFSNAVCFGRNVKGQNNQSTGFSLSEPIRVYMLDEQCIYSATSQNGQSVHVMYAEESTPEDPIVRIFGHAQSGEYEKIVHINDIDPTNATYPELCALLAHKTRTDEYTPEKGTLLRPLPMGVDCGNYAQKFDCIQMIQEYTSSNNQAGQFYPTASSDSLLEFYNRYLDEWSRKSVLDQTSFLKLSYFDYSGRLRVENLMNQL